MMGHNKHKKKNEMKVVKSVGIKAQMIDFIDIQLPVGSFSL